MVTAGEAGVGRWLFRDMARVTRKLWVWSHGGRTLWDLGSESRVKCGVSRTDIQNILWVQLWQHGDSLDCEVPTLVQC